MVRDMRIDGAALRVTRIRAGLFQAELAERSGVDRTVISRLERGLRVGTPAQLKALAEALDVDAATLCPEVAA